AAHFGIVQVRIRGLGGPGEQLLAIDDLQDAALVRAVAEVDAVRLRSHRDRSVQLYGRLARGTGLLSGEPEVADELRMRGIGKVVDLRHAPHAPTLDAGDEIRDAGVAFPPALV